MSVTFEYRPGMPGLSITGVVCPDAAGDAAGTDLAFVENTNRRGVYSVAAAVAAGKANIRIAGDLVDSIDVIVPSSGSCIFGAVPNQLAVNDEGGVDALIGAFSDDALVQLAGMTLAVQSPGAVDVEDGALEIVAGDDYLHVDGRAFTLNFSGSLLDITGGTATILLITSKNVARSFTATIVSSTTLNLQLRLELNAVDSVLLEIGEGTWKGLFATSAGKKWSVVERETDDGSKEDLPLLVKKRGS